ncbi:MAG: acylneuraminate cytidylyltransferase family protein [bacterium]|nr:acylneuraminate cytidylyltransferase family protein [bacterium]
MYRDKTIIAIIPARGGSQGLPGKNILPFCGKPLISWTIAQALKSKYLDKVLVSTDEKKIADIAQKYGADVPFLRPRRLATAASNIIDVLIHTLDFINRKEKKYDLVMLLQPTSPLRTSKDIDLAIELFFREKAQAVISVCRSEHHPWWSVSLGNNLRVAEYLGQGKLHKNRQILPDFYRINGAIYLTREITLRQNKSFLGKSTYAYIMPVERSLDIDSKLEFTLAEFLADRERSKRTSF